MFKFAGIGLLVGILYFVASQIPCDDQYGTHCPEASGLDVGTCLKKLSAEELGSACQSYIDMHDACAEDIAQHCVGKEYTGDLLVCLSEWTSPSLLSENCQNALPKKEQSTRNLSKEAKKKADARRKIRNRAAKQARKEL